MYFFLSLFLWVDDVTVSMFVNFIKPFLPVDIHVYDDSRVV